MFTKRVISSSRRLFSTASEFSPNANSMFPAFKARDNALNTVDMEKHNKEFWSEEEINEGM